MQNDQMSQQRSVNVLLGLYALLIIVLQPNAMAIGLPEKMSNIEEIIDCQKMHRLKDL